MLSRFGHIFAPLRLAVGIAHVLWSGLVMGYATHRGPFPGVPTLNAHNATLIFMYNSMVLHSMLLCNPRSNRHNLCDIYNIACGEEMRLMP